MRGAGRGAEEARRAHSEAGGAPGRSLQRRGRSAAAAGAGSGAGKARSRTLTAARRLTVMICQPAAKLIR